MGEFFVGEAHADKYQSGNWIARKLVRNFMASILHAVQQAGNHDVHEIGCGEGHILGVLAKPNFNVRGCDISDSSLSVAARESSRHGFTIPLAKLQKNEGTPTLFDSKKTKGHPRCLLNRRRSHCESFCRRMETAGINSKKLNCV